MAESSCSSKCNCGTQKELIIEGETIEAGHPRLIIPELCELMYHEGWMTGTGGGMSIKKEYVRMLSIAHIRGMSTSNF